MPPAMPGNFSTPNFPITSAPAQQKSKKSLIIVVLLILLSLVAGGLVAYQKFFKDKVVSSNEISVSDFQQAAGHALPSLQVFEGIIDLREDDRGFEPLFASLSGEKFARHISVARDFYNNIEKKSLKLPKDYKYRDDYLARFNRLQKTLKKELTLFDNISERYQALSSVYSNNDTTKLKELMKKSPENKSALDEFLNIYLETKAATDNIKKNKCDAQPASTCDKFFAQLEIADQYYRNIANFQALFPEIISFKNSTSSHLELYHLQKGIKLSEKKHD